MKSIKLTKKDIKQIAESCVKNILKERSEEHTSEIFFKII
mgnify:CR=1 FL=1